MKIPEIALFILLLLLIRSKIYFNDFGKEEMYDVN